MATAKTKKSADTKAAQVAQESVVRTLAKIDSIILGIPQANEILVNLGKEVELIKADLTLGLKEFELDIENKKRTVEDTFTNKVEEIKEAISEAEKDKQNKEAKFLQEIENLQNKLNRQKEELEYQAKQSVDRINLETATTIATSLHKVLVDKSEFNKVTELANKNFTRSEEELKEIVNKAKSEVYQELKPKIKDVETTSASQIALLTKELELAKQQLIEAREEKDYFKKELAKIPTQLKDAVEAAKVSVANYVGNSDKK